LSVRYAFSHRTSNCNQTFQKSSSHPGEGRHLLSFQEKLILRPKKPAYVANQSDCSIRYCWSAIEHHFVNTENMQPEVLKGCEFESGVHVSQNLISRPETNRKIVPRKTVKENYAIEKMMIQEFSDVINSNLWSNHIDNLRQHPWDDRAPCHISKHSIKFRFLIWCSHLVQHHLKPLNPNF